MTTKYLLACTAALAVFSHPATAAPGDLDLTFGGTGKVTTDFGFGGDAYGHSVAMQSDGKIVVAGQAYNGSSYGFAVARYNANGTLDSSFNGSGKVMTATGLNGGGAKSLAVQSDGRIVVAGWSFSAGVGYDFAVGRYNADGTLDTTFNSTGIVTTDIGGTDYGESVVVQSDAKIVVAGRATDIGFAIVRYNTDGSLDTSFNGNGKVTTNIGSYAYAYSVTLQSDGKILVAGEAFNADFVLVRYNTDGSLDTSFNGTGIVTTPIGSGLDSGLSVKVQNDAKIVVAGYSQSTNFNIALVRYNSDGSLDTNFNGTGKVTTAIGNYKDAGQSVAIQNDGRIVVAGRTRTAVVNNDAFDDFAVVRYNTDGSLDADFNGTGSVTTAFGSGLDSGRSVALQSNGKIVVAGFSRIGSNLKFALARYEVDIDTDRDGIPDLYETGTGIYVSPTDTGTSPTNPDTDGDGLNDGQEVNTYLSNPHVKDTDGDGFEDGFEVATGFSPTSALSTPDAQSTILTAVEYRFNAAPGISYRIESSTDLLNWVTVETNIVGTGGFITRFYSTEGQPKRFFRSRRN